MNCVRGIIGVLAVLAIGLTGGCKSAYYGTLEKFGVEKRDILVDRVEEARDAQEDTKEQFADALEAFSALTGFEGGDLEKVYDRLKGQLKDSEASAERVGARIDAIEKVARDLFGEWQMELEQYSNATYRRESEKKLRQTRERYDDVMTAMRRAEAKIEPVLVRFRDHVLFLKHNLNAQAIASLGRQSLEIEDDVKELIKEMESSIAEANSFIDTLRGTSE